MVAFAVPDEQTITEAYIYLLGRMLVIRQERTDAAADGFGYNTVKYNPLGSADFVNPNFDVAYLEAWFAVDEAAAVLLEVPEITGRYYTAQILDEWGEVIVNVNERAAAVKPSGTFALVKPGSSPPVPAGATRIDLHSAKANMLARVELKSDPDTAVRLQKEFSVAPLGQVTVSPPPVIPHFDNKTLLGAEIFDDADAILGGALDVVTGRGPDAASGPGRRRARRIQSGGPGRCRLAAAGHGGAAVPGVRVHPERALPQPLDRRRPDRQLRGRLPDPHRGQLRRDLGQHQRGGRLLRGHPRRG